MFVFLFLISFQKNAASKNLWLENFKCWKFFAEGGLRKNYSQF